MEINLTNFDDFKRDYENYKTTLLTMEDILQELCRFLKGVTDVPVDGEDFSYYNPFDFTYNEKIDKIFFESSNIKVWLSYKDYYEGYDSSSNLTIPRDIFNKWVAGDKEGITKQVLNLCKVGKMAKDIHDFENLKNLAEELGYKITKKVEDGK